MYRIHQIKLRPGEPESSILSKICKKTGLRAEDVTEWEIVRESLDARDKSDIRWVYSVDFDIRHRGGAVSKKTEARLSRAGVSKASEQEYSVKSLMNGHNRGETKKDERPVVVGFGPCGIFCALILAQAGLRPLVIERGRDADSRTADVEKFWKDGILDTESNVQFGEGGAGTFSDGKLTTGIKDIRIRKVLRELADHGAPGEILYKQRPHIGTDLLRNAVKSLREEIIRLGGEVMFETKLTGFETVPGQDGEEIRGIRAFARQDGREISIPCRHVVLAVGHSARDTFEMLKEEGVSMEQKPFSIGVRIEHPQDLIDIAQYGRPGRELGLPPAEYKVSYRCTEGTAAGRGVYSFCMCPGGEVILASSEAEGVVVNGMSYHARRGKRANSALLCDVRPEDFGSDDVLAGVRFQQKYEHIAWMRAGGRYAAPSCAWGDFRDQRAPHVRECLPDFAAEALCQAMPELGKKLKGFDWDGAKMYAVETRSSSPVRIIRDKSRQSLSLKGLYPAGEGAGYAGGIMSAAVDGIKTAEKITEDFYL